MQFRLTQTAAAKELVSIRNDVAALHEERDAIGLQIDTLEQRASELSTALRELQWANIQRAKPFSLNEIKHAAETKGKLNAVKMFKDMTGASLMDAKHSIELLAAGQGWQFPTS